MTRVYLIRHGRVEWNINDAAYAGWTDLPLDQTGTEQARLLADRLEYVEFSAVYSSDRQRSITTAKEIAERHSLEVQIVPELREINYGDWEGLSAVQIKERYGDLFDEWRRDAERVKIPGGETAAELSNRTLPAINDIVKKHPDQVIAIVAHKTVNRILICHWLDMSISRYKEIGQYNVAINIIRFIGNRVVIETVNDVCHVRR